MIENHEKWHQENSLNGNAVDSSLTANHRERPLTNCFWVSWDEDTLRFVSTCVKPLIRAMIMCTQSQVHSMHCLMCRLAIQTSKLWVRRTTALTMGYRFECQDCPHSRGTQKNTSSPCWWHLGLPYRTSRGFKFRPSNAWAHPRNSGERNDSLEVWGRVPDLRRQGTKLKAFLTRWLHQTG